MPNMYPGDFNALSNNAGYAFSASLIIQPRGGAMDSTMVHLLFYEKNKPAWYAAVRMYYCLYAFNYRDSRAAL